MTSVPYSTVSNYVTGRDFRVPGRDALQAIMHLREALEPIQPGIAAKLQPHLNALELVIRQTLDDSGAEARGAEPESTHPWRRERA